MSESQEMTKVMLSDEEYESEFEEEFEEEDEEEPVYDDLAVLKRSDYPIFCASELREIVQHDNLKQFYKQLFFTWQDDLEHDLNNLEKTIGVIFDDLVREIDMDEVGYPHVLSAIDDLYGIDDDEEEEEKTVEFSVCFSNIVKFIKRNKEMFVENKEQEEFLNKLIRITYKHIAQQLIENGELD